MCVYEVICLEDETAEALLPLADEYQIDSMRKACIDQLMKQTSPQLSHIRLADTYNLPELFDKATESCGDLLSPQEIERQLSLTENQDFPQSILVKVYRWAIYDLFGILESCQITQNC